MEFYCNDQKKQDVFIASCFLYDITDDILLFLYRLVERLSEVGYYVVHVFYADGKAYQVGGYACFLELFIGQLAVRMACRMRASATWVTMFIILSESMNLIAVSRSPFNPNDITPHEPSGRYFCPSS